MNIISKDGLAKYREPITFPPNFRLSDHVREVGHRVYEFIGADTFGAEWKTRQEYEIDAGRDLEPILYEPFYSIVRDANLPKNVTVNTLGPAGVFFSEVTEGGEVKFQTVTSGQYSIPIRHFAVGLEYSKDLVLFNELWDVALHERQVGIAYNALLNHIHLSPFLTFAYTSANQTPAVTATAMTWEERAFRTIENAIVASKTDTANPRRGPYAILCSADDVFLLERALKVVPQLGFTKQSSAQGMIRDIVAYDGWAGTMGGLSVSYPGVTGGRCYLIDIGNKDRYIRSFMKQGLEVTRGNPDVSRFLVDQVVWDCYFGTYVNVAAVAEEVTLPTP